MNTETKLHVARYDRYMDDDTNVSVIIGNLEEILISQYLYEQRHGIPSESSDVQNRLLNACALAAASLMDKESWGWTVTLPGIDDGYFVGVEPEGMICTRRKPAKTELTKAYLQRQKSGGPLMQSHFEPENACPVKTVMQYFNQVVQTDTRIAIADKDGIMVQALPGTDFSTIRQMTDDQLIDFYRSRQANGELKAMQEYLIFYECRCDEEMIYKMMESLPPNQKDEIFSSENIIEIECPRCGRQYTARKKDLLN